jgi:HD-GYP domain-containing protein (c-di-GMP phosphodiesterase class II)
MRHSRTPGVAEDLPLSEQPIRAARVDDEAGRQTTDVLVRVLAERHPDIGEHLDAVARLSAEVADELALSGDEQMTVVQAASLHDIGKVAIPDRVLTKPSRLDEEEWQYILEHTVVGQRILDAAPSLVRASKLVRWSHERWDGDGYPDAITGDEIPLGARIVAVCDAYDAMTSQRPYAESRSSAEAIAELRSCAGTQFDPDVVEAFARVIQRNGRAT